MNRMSFFSAAVAILMSFCLGSSAYAAGPEEQLIESVQVALDTNFNTDWSWLDAPPEIKWAPLPPTNLQKFLLGGRCFARQSSAKFGDYSLNVVASGARAIVTNIYFRSIAAQVPRSSIRFSRLYPVEPAAHRGVSILPSMAA